MATNEPTSSQGQGPLRRRILRNMALFLYRRPFVASLIILAVTVLAGWSARHHNFSLNLRSHLPLPEQTAEALESMLRLTPAYSPITAVVHIHTDAAPSMDEQARIAAHFVRAWDDPLRVASVQYLAPDAGRDDEEDLPLSYQDILARLRPGDMDALRRAEDPQDGADWIIRKILEQAELRGHRLGTQESKIQSPSLENLRLPEAVLSEVTRDPLGLLRGLRYRGDMAPGPYPFSAPQSLRIPSRPKRMVFQIVPLRSSSEVFYSLDLRKFLEKSVTVLDRKEALDIPEINLTLYGRHVDTAQMAERFLIDMARSLIVLFFCMLLLLLLAFRKAESFFFVLIPPMVGLVWTYGLLSLTNSQFSLLAAVFPFLLVGIGIEFVSQIYHRFTEELYREGHYYLALGSAYSEAGRGIFVSATITMLIFFSLRLSSFEILRELALAGTLGVLCMGLAALLLLPPMAALKSRFARGKVEPMDICDFNMNSVSAMVIASPRTLLGLALLLSLYLGYYSTRFEISTLAGLDMASPQTMQTTQPKTKYQRLQVTDKPISIFLASSDLQDVLGRNDKLYSTLLQLKNRMEIGRIQSLSPILPSLTLQQSVRSELLRLDLAQLRLSFQAAAEKMGLPSDAFQPFMASLQGLTLHVQASRPMDIASLQDGPAMRAAQAMMVKDGDLYRVVTTVFPRMDSLLAQSNYFEEFRDALTGTQPLDAPAILFHSEFQQNKKVGQAVIQSAALMVLVSLLSLALCLLPHFRRQPLHALLACVPVACAVIWTLGLFALTEQKTGLYALLTFPLVIGISVNQSILFIQRLRDRRYASLRQIVRSGGRPIALVGWSLALGLACFSLVRFTPLREMAVVALTAIVISVLTTLTLIPAIQQIRREGGLTGWTAEDE